MQINSHSKFLKMKKRLIILSLALVFGAFLYSFIPQKQLIEKTIRITSPNSKLDFTLVNKTGYTIDAVHVAPNDQESWGANILSDDLPHNSSVLVYFDDQEGTKIWDIKVFYKGYDDSEARYWQNFDLSTINEITLFWKAEGNKSWATWK